MRSEHRKPCPAIPIRLAGLAALLVPLWFSLCSFAQRQTGAVDLPWRTVPIQVVQVSDDDGGRQASITPQEMQDWVDSTNPVFAQAHLRFTWRGDARDSVSLRSTLLNNLMESADARFREAV